MATLNVTCAGDRAKDILDGGARILSAQVHSVFQKAVNVSLLTDEGPCLLTLISSDAHPWALTCPDLPESQKISPLRPGMNFFPGRRGDILPVFSPCGPELDLSGAEIWTQPSLSVAADQPTLARNNSKLLSALSGGHSDFSERSAMARIRGVIIECQKGASSQPPFSLLSGLIGLGPGLTPLGDDFVSGYLATVSLAASTAKLREDVRFAAVRLAEGDTTFFSKRQITLAGQGVCLRSIFSLIRSIASPTFDESTLKRVLAIGATSGQGWALGISAAISSIAPLYSGQKMGIITMHITKEMIWSGQPTFM